MIKLQFVDGGYDPASEAIKIFERGWCSHVDVVRPDGLLGARLDGVKLRQPGYDSVVRVENITLAATAQQLADFNSFLDAQIGKPYDKTAIAAFPFQRNWQETDSWFCSELVAAALEASGWWPKPLSESTNHITPRDLLLIVSPWRIES